MLDASILDGVADGSAPETNPIDGPTGADQGLDLPALDAPAAADTATASDLSSDLSPLDAAAGADAAQPDLSPGDSTIMLDAPPGPTNVTWAKQVGGTLADQYTSVAVDPSTGNVYLAGSFIGKADFGGGPITAYGSQDVFVARYFPDGTLDWVQHYGGLNNEMARGLAVDANGNAYVVGAFKGTADFGGGTVSSVSPLYDDLFIASYNGSNGSPRWATTGGSTSTDWATAVAVDPSGHVTVTGFFRGTVDFGNNVSVTAGGQSQDMFVVSLNSQTGDANWAKSYGGAGMDDPDAGFGVAADSASNIYVTGYFRENMQFLSPCSTIAANGTEDIFLASFDPAGTCRWAKGFGTLSVERGLGVAVDSSSHVYITGYYYGPTDFGGSSPLYSAGGRDVFVASYYAPNGAYRWATSYGGLGTDEGNAVTVAADGAVFVTGFFAGTADFDGIGRTSYGLSDAFVLRADPMGTVSWVEQIGGTATDEGLSLATHSGPPNPVLYATGTFEDTVNLGAGAWTSFGSKDIFLLQMQP